MSQQPKTNTEVQHLSLFDYSEQSKKALSYRQVHAKNLFGHLSQTKDRDSYYTIKTKLEPV